MAGKEKNNKLIQKNNLIIPEGEQTVRKRGRPKGSKNATIRRDHDIHTEEGDNRKFLSHDMKLFRLPSIDLENSEAVQERINLYFDICAEDDVKPSIASLALAFNVSRFILYNWISDRTEYIKNKQSILAIKNAYNLINSYYEHMMNTGKINPVAGIFLMKNNMGYKDNTEHVISVNQDNNVTDNDIYNRAALYD